MFAVTGNCGPDAAAALLAAGFTAVITKPFGTKDLKDALLAAFGSTDTSDVTARGAGAALLTPGE
jgi:CheY-like chemotaxis protein